MTQTGDVRLPPEWAPQEWLWIGFPHEPDEWGEPIGQAQEEIAGFANAVAESGQEVRLLVRDAANEKRARALVSGAVTLERRVYGDVWLRDTGPIVVDRGGKRAAVRPGFNGWGDKYLMAGDECIGAELAEDAELALNQPDWVLEGGAIDTNGQGTVLTTEQCLLNPNRNPRLSREEIEARLTRDFGLTKVVWLGDGLLNDHTDGSKPPVLPSRRFPLPALSRAATGWSLPATPTSSSPTRSSLCRPSACRKTKTLWPRSTRCFLPVPPSACRCSASWRVAGAFTARACRCPQSGKNLFTRERETAGHGPHYRPRPTHRDTGHGAHDHREHLCNCADRGRTLRALRLTP